jgi:N-acetylglucosamine kinase-like BadF-type ATPase
MAETMAGPALLAGFDAGQTKTRCRLSDLQGRVLAEGEGSGVSHLHSATGPEKFQAALASSLAAARQGLGPELRQPKGPLTLAAAAIGASGIEQHSPSQALGTHLAQELLGIEAVLVGGDESTALAGAFGGGPGIVLISGTGSICVGRNSLGQLHRCGGWGWLLDGGGSAMDIGRDGLAVSLRMADGRLRETPLKALLWQALGVQHSHQLKALVVDPNFGAAGFARLAPLVSAQAASGDPQALAIIERAGRELAMLVEGVAKALGLEQPPLCCLGGAIEHLEPLQRSFQRVLTERLPGTIPQAPLGDACSGALALAHGLIS